MDKKDWMIRHLAQRLVWLGDCTLKKKDMESCPMAFLQTSAEQHRNVCVDCILESAEDAWLKESSLRDGKEAEDGSEKV